MYYVRMIDPFFRSWGGCKKGQDNLLIIECETLEEANTVADNARDRGDQECIHIIKTDGSPEPRGTDRFVVSKHNKADYPHWFEKGYFKRQAEKRLEEQRKEI